MIRVGLGKGKLSHGLPTGGRIGASRRCRFRGGRRRARPGTGDERDARGRAVGSARGAAAGPDRYERLQIPAALFREMNAMTSARALVLAAALATVSAAANAQSAWPSAQPQAQSAWPSQPQQAPWPNSAPAAQPQQAPWPNSTPQAQPMAAPPMGGGGGFG